jgi:prepilin signal peptidase PulO-like enzyme (type II secretory pathway)
MTASEQDLRPNPTILFGVGGAVALVSTLSLPWPLALASTILGALMIAGAEVDARTYLLPDAVTWGGIASGILAASALNPFEPWLSAGAAVARALGTAVAVVLAMGLRPDQRSRRSRLWRCQARGGGRRLASACVDTVLLLARDLPCFGDGHVRTPARWEHRCDSEVAVRCVPVPRPLAGLLCG